MTPAEARFVELMGGHIYRLKFIKHPKSKFPLVIFWRYGKILSHEKFKREVRIGKYFVDFCNDTGIVIEIDGQPYHMDVLADLERDGYLRERGHLIIRVPAHRLWRDPNRVQRDVLKLIYY